MTLVIGEISYTNILPMFYYIDRNKLKEYGCEFVPAIPAKLNEDMANGLVDVGGISSFSYGEHSNEYRIFPDLSVSSTGKVGSIFLFSKRPIEKLEGSNIGLTSSSATSVNLLKIILHRFYELNVSFETTYPNYDNMMKQYDACLLIGDDAIMASLSKDASVYIYDLGEVWEKFTDLPMTYAVFATRKETFKKQASLLTEVHHQFLKSKARCIDNNFFEMIKSIQYQLGGTTSFWNGYFSGLNYELSDRHLDGLYHYFDLAHDLKLLEKPVKEISIWKPSSHVHSV
ncbi:menaquinone biosynthesis protein [Salipaludibacillus daqingensis]|uniref:menaquinone biosynthesis protein n=1 Tax=Salipaludibacillus daqingensis TaxID=3041001 RepID=UPI002473BD3D|nr:menaquinone biosynthesis protein [Salipaludibacillus daqingensis]